MLKNCIKCMTKLSTQNLGIEYVWLPFQYVFTCHFKTKLNEKLYSYFLPLQMQTFWLYSFGKTWHCGSGNLGLCTFIILCLFLCCNRILNTFRCGYSRVATGNSIYSLSVQHMLLCGGRINENGSCTLVLQNLL